MKKFRKLASTVLALVMVAALSLTAFAAPGDMECDPSVSISGLQDGDSVAFYKVLEWNDGWKIASGFESKADDLDAIVAGEISSTLAGELGKLVSGAGSVVTITAEDGTATYHNPAPGLYMAIITANTPGYFYNPVFVAADFNPDNETADLTVNGTLSYSDKGRAKVNFIDLTKEADKITANVGNTVTFTVTTMVPVYASNYTNPVFRLTDVLSEGLAINEDVSVAELSTDDYDVDYDIDDYDYVLTVKPSYLQDPTRSEGTSITITYTATVTNEANFSINQDDNTVTLEYSNRPDDVTGAGRLRDKTKHYTFTIDGELFGSTGYEASEIVKVGVDADGNEITEEHLSNGSTIGALEGAKFTLYTNEACTDIYSNTIFNGAELVSDANGHITMKGLDKGTYWLKETEAPAGYIKSQDVVKIEIEVEEDSISVTEKVDGQDVTYDVKVLKAYHIYMTVGENGSRQETANYVLTNEGPVLKEVSKGDNAGKGTDEDGNLVENGDLGKIFNTKGTALPATGGIGTTIFYILGGCLIVGAGVLLVVKKRVGGKEET